MNRLDGRADVLNMICPMGMSYEKESKGHI